MCARFAPGRILWDLFHYHANMCRTEEVSGNKSGYHRTSCAEDSLRERGRVAKYKTLCRISWIIHDEWAVDCQAVTAGALFAPWQRLASNSQAFDHCVNLKYISTRLWNYSTCKLGMNSCSVLLAWSCFLRQHSVQTFTCFFQRKVPFPFLSLTATAHRVEFSRAVKSVRSVPQLWSVEGLREEV